MEFICNKSWSELATTDNQNIKFCMTCFKDVHLCETQKDLSNALKNGFCIAYETEFRFSQHSDTHFTLGLPKGYRGFDKLGDQDDKAD